MDYELIIELDLFVINTRSIRDQFAIKMHIKTKRKGFTIAELILVIAIIGILFAAGSRTYLAERRRFIYNDSLNQIVMLIKTARNYAVTSRSAFLADGTSVVPPEGYGVHISRSDVAGTSKVRLFANVGAADKTNQFDGDDLVEEEFTLPKITKFEAMLKDAKEAMASLSEAVIIFRPPLAETFISNNLEPDVPANVVDTLYLRFSNRESPAGADKQFISINRTAGFPELELR